MEQLKQRILKDGVALGKDVVKVDSFLNHQLDVKLISEIGLEFKRRFEGAQATKILTIEASGIAVACAVAWHMGGLPVVFAKKASPSTMVDGMYQAKVTSFTKGTSYHMVVSQKYLTKADRVLIIDDFLAHGEAAAGLASLAEQAGATLVGIGAVIEKEYQGGSARLREKGFRVESLAVIASIEDGNIKFSE